ncbi:MAG: hypothetical protein OXR73_28955 [Myxococcales bacterium]|nr:hypothetical protein [Myxococcales bacterium]
MDSTGLAGPCVGDGLSAPDPDGTGADSPATVSAFGTMLVPESEHPTARANQHTIAATRIDTLPSSKAAATEEGPPLDPFPTRDRTGLL